MRVDKKRRRENKTDYRLRKNLLKSGLGRVVFRRSNKYINGQFIKSEEARDHVLINVNSRELIKFGWPKDLGGSLKSLSACYLTGFMLGKKIQDKDEKKGILDIGLIRSIKGGRVYAFCKGVSDSGFKIKVSEDMFPKEEKLKKDNVDLEKIKEKIKNG